MIEQQKIILKKYQKSKIKIKIIFNKNHIIQRNIPPKKTIIIENNISMNFKILAYHLNIIKDQIILNFYKWFIECFCEIYFSKNNLLKNSLKYFIFILIF